MESGLRPAVAQLENRQRRFGLQPGGRQRGVRRSRKGIGIGFARIENSGNGHDLHGCCSVQGSREVSRDSGHGVEGYHNS